MVSKEDLLAKGFIEQVNNVFIKGYQRGIMIINGVQHGSHFNFRITLDNSDVENELGSYIQFHIDTEDGKDWILGRTGYYTDIQDLQKDIKINL